MAQQSRIGTVATTVTGSRGNLCVTYHQTRVVEVIDGNIVLNSGGWRTATTKTRMNQTARQFGLNFTVYQSKHNWYVCAWLEGTEPFKNGKVQDFTDGMVVSFPSAKE